MPGGPERRILKLWLLPTLTFILRARGPLVAERAEEGEQDAGETIWLGLWFWIKERMRSICWSLYSSR